MLTHGEFGRINREVIAFILLILAGPGLALSADEARPPERIPPKRSSQIQDGLGGVNSSLPRNPYIPWTRRWWTRMFDGGFKWARIGQYEDSSDITGWDWVEHQRGVYSVAPELDDYVDSLVDNGVETQLQLCYGNPMYTAPAGKLPDSIIPAPESVHNPDYGLYSIFWPPKTPEQIEAFARYTKWMVNHFKGRIRYYALWNEQDGSYWNAHPNPEEYGRLLKAFVQAVHEADPQARVIYGGQASLSTDFARRALDTCQCASDLDVFAYHTYPGGYARNINPEAIDYGAFGDLTPKALREMVRNYPGIKANLEFWDDEFNSLPSLPRDKDESVQANYVARCMVYNWAAGVRTYLWELINDTNTSEGDEFGIIHGMMYKPTDFVPRPVFYALQNVNALFSDTKLDASIEITGPDLFALRRTFDGPFLRYGFRSRNGKALVAWWLGVQSWPHTNFIPYYTPLTLKNTGIEHPVLIDVLTGEITPLEWKEGTQDTLERVPIRDTVLAVADASYFDWPLLPEAPSPLTAQVASGTVRLKWETAGGAPTGIAVERRAGTSGKWERVAKLAANTTEYTDRETRKGESLSYRVRALNGAGESAYSNVVRVTP